MARRGFYPPSHRRTDVPQPEVCDVTGFVVYGHDLVVSEAKGLAGRRVSSASKFLAHARNTPAEWQDEINVPDLIGQGRIYEPGAEKWFGPEWSQEWSTPQDLAELVLWLRNDDIPYSGFAERWPTPGGLGLHPAVASSTVARPLVESDPFGSDYRGLSFAGSNDLALEQLIELPGPFTYLVGFKTPPVGALIETALLRGITASVRISATGAVVLVNDAGTMVDAAVGAVASSSSYVLSVIRSVAGALTVRVNGVDVSVGASLAGPLTLWAVGHGGGVGLTLIHAEHSIHAADHQADNRFPSLERTLARYVGIEL